MIGAATAQVARPAACGGQEGGEGGALLGATPGAVAAGDLVVDDAVPEVTLGAVVGQFDGLAVEADEELVAVAAVALLELPGLADADREAEDQPVGRALDPHPTIRECRWRDPIPLAIQTKHAAEDVAQLARPLRPGRAVDLDSIGQVADLVA
jgi:hypothetical protein